MMDRSERHGLSHQKTRSTVTNSSTAVKSLSRTTSFNESDPSERSQQRQKMERARKAKTVSNLTTVSATATATAVVSSKITASDRQRVQEDLKKRTIILPWDKKYRTWFGLTVVAALFTVFFEPFQIAFGNVGITPYSQPSTVLEFILGSLFALDIIVNFNLAYNDESEGIVYDRRSIAKHYFKLMFWVDLFGIFPFYILALVCTGQLGQDTMLALNLSILRLSRLVRVHRLKIFFGNLRYNTNVSFMWLTLIRNSVYVLVWTNFCRLRHVFHQSPVLFRFANVDREQNSRRA